jgi:hypothetical protein
MSLQNYVMKGGKGIHRGQGGGSTLDRQYTQGRQELRDTGQEGKGYTGEREEGGAWGTGWIHCAFTSTYLCCPLSCEGATTSLISFIILIVTVCFINDVGLCTWFLTTSTPVLSLLSALHHI